MYSLLNGVQINYEVMGEGDPILLVHGWGGSLDSLRALGEMVSDTHKVILVDLPGFGKSANPPGDWGVGEYANLITALLENLKIKKITYFGHSFGGAIGLILSTKPNSVVSKLILCNSALKRPNKTVKIPLFLKSVLFRTKSIRIWTYRIFFPNSDIAKHPHLESNFKRIMQQDLSHLPPKIKTPTLIIWGEGDTFTPVAWAYELHQQIANSLLKIIPGERHGLPLRNPEIVAKEIRDFLHS